MIVGLFAITAPIAVLPIFVAATEGQTGSQQRRTAMIAVATYVGAGAIALFVGNAVLGFFGVSVAALRVAGMAVIAVIGWQMLNAPTPSADDADGDGAATGTHHLHAASNTKVARAGVAGRKQIPSPLTVGIMPLGFPIYAGPGVLSVIIAWGSGSKPVYLSALVAILSNAAIILALDFLATPITRLIGSAGLLVTEKVFGLIVVAIAVTGMTSALLVLFPGLAGSVH
jgi:multiple antibiotic resistance protein